VRALRVAIVAAVVIAMVAVEVPRSVGAVTVIVNICVLGGCAVGLGCELLAVNRPATPARIDVA